jgi:methyl-accepting chemotaxis protein
MKSLKFRLFSGYGIAVGLFFILAAFNFYFTTDLGKDLKEIIGKSMPKTEAILKFEAKATQVRNAKLTLMGLNANSAKEMGSKYLQAAEDEFAEVKSIMLDFEKLSFSNSELESFSKIKNAFPKWSRIHLRQLEILKVRTPLVLNGQEVPEAMAKEYAQLAKDVLVPFEEMLENMKKIQKENEAAVRAIGDSAAQDIFEGNLASAVLFLLGTGGLVFLGLRLSSSVSGEIARISLALNGIVKKTGRTANELSSSSQELAQGVTEQASAVQETASAVEQLTAIGMKTGENARASSQLAGASEAAAERGRTCVSQVAHSVKDIESSYADVISQVKESNDRFADVIKVIQDIATKTKVINEIVFQTKLLSINASVEAARAGEHGKGFAVVAEEVGSLAQMSGTAARDIESMLSSSVDRVQSIVSEAKNRIEGLVSVSRSRIDQGLNSVKASEQIIEDVYENVSKARQMAKEIEVATTEQAKGIQEISTAMTQLDQVTQSSSLSSERSAQSAGVMLTQSKQLEKCVRSLKLLVEGSEGGNLNTHLNQNEGTDEDDGFGAAPGFRALANNGKRSRPQKAAFKLTKPDSRFGDDHHKGDDDVVGFHGVPSQSDNRFKDAS